MSMWVPRQSAASINRVDHLNNKVLVLCIHQIAVSF